MQCAPTEIGNLFFYRPLRPEPGAFAVAGGRADVLGAAKNRADSLPADGCPARSVRHEGIGAVVHHLAAAAIQVGDLKSTWQQPFRMTVGKGVVAASMMDDVEVIAVADRAGRCGRVVLDGVQAVAI